MVSPRADPKARIVHTTLSLKMPVGLQEGGGTGASRRCMIKQVTEYGSLALRDTKHGKNELGQQSRWVTRDPFLVTGITSLELLACPARVFGKDFVRLLSKELQAQSWGCGWGVLRCPAWALAAPAF